MSSNLRPQNFDVFLSATAFRQIGVTFAVVTESKSVGKDLIEFWAFLFVDDKKRAAPSSSGLASTLPSGLNTGWGISSKALPA